MIGQNGFYNCKVFYNYSQILKIILKFCDIQLVETTHNYYKKKLIFIPKWFSNNNNNNNNNNNFF